MQRLPPERARPLPGGVPDSGRRRCTRRIPRVRSRPPNALAARGAFAARGARAHQQPAVVVLPQRARRDLHSHPRRWRGACSSRAHAYFLGFEKLPPETHGEIALGADDWLTPRPAVLQERSGKGARHDGRSDRLVLQDVRQHARWFGPSVAKARVHSSIARGDGGFAAATPNAPSWKRATRACTAPRAGSQTTQAESPSPRTSQRHPRNPSGSATLRPPRARSTSASGPSR